ncbi:hypothetical protein ACJJTC_002852 [Scirpophaga incertulas]
MNENCLIKSKDLTLYFPHPNSNQINYSPKIYLPEIDQINHIVKIKIPIENSTELTDINFRDSITKLERQIIDLKSSKPELDDISSHDISHYTITSILTIAIVCGILLWMWKYSKCCQRRRSHRDQNRRSTAVPEPEDPIPLRRMNSEPVYGVVNSRKATTANRQLSASDVGESSVARKSSIYIVNDSVA